MPVPASAVDPIGAREVASPAAPLTPSPLAQGPIVLATRGDPATDAALAVAWQLAGRTNADVQVLTAVEPAVPTDVRFTVIPPPPDELRLAERDTQLTTVHVQLRRVVGQECDWPIALVDGTADEAIARFVEAHGARVLLVGRGRHGVVGRALSGETVLRLLRRVDTPVYAVEPGGGRLARRIVAAVDFSTYSLHAVRTALALAAPGAALTLAHVRPHATTPRQTAWEQTYDRGLAALFQQAREALGAAEAVTVETVTLAGRSPGQAVSEYVAGAQADLVVSGTHGHGFVSRLVLGSVAAELLGGHRARSCASPAPPLPTRQPRRRR